MRVVNDFAGQEHPLRRETPAGLVGVVHGPVDTVAEAELAREMDREPARLKSIVGVFDLPNEGAVIARSEDAGHLMLEVESFSEDERGHYCGS